MFFMESLKSEIKRKYKLFLKRFYPFKYFLNGLIAPLFNKYLLSTHSGPGPVLWPGDTAVSKS